MAHKPTTKPAKPTVTAVRVQSICGGATLATILTLCVAWQVHVGHWSKVVFDMTLVTTALAWIGVIAAAHARHVTLYVRECTKVNGERHTQTQNMIKHGSVVHEAERYLRSQEN